MLKILHSLRYCFIGSEYTHYIDTVFAKGRVMVEKGTSIAKGTFEE
jgi:hypothetical protein